MSSESENRDERLLPTRRLKKRSDYLRIQADGKKHHSDHFLLAFIEARPRIGVTITTKVDKRAVARNRLRRRIREFYRRNLPDFQRSLEIVVIAKRGACGLSYEDVLREITFLFKRCGLLKK